MDDPAATAVSAGDIDLNASIPTGQQIYDSIMGWIEPELTSSSLPLLEEKYRSESEADRAIRMQRYGQAFAQYEEAYKGYIDAIDRQVEACKRSARESAEWNSRFEEDEMQDSLVSQMAVA